MNHHFDIDKSIMEHFLDQWKIQYSEIRNPCFENPDVDIVQTSDRVIGVELTKYSDQSLHQESTIEGQLHDSIRTKLLDLGFEDFVIRIDYSQSNARISRDNFSDEIIKIIQSNNKKWETTSQTLIPTSEIGKVVKSIYVYKNEGSKIITNSDLNSKYLVADFFCQTSL
jgi:hypothetical protein